MAGIVGQKLDIYFVKTIQAGNVFVLVAYLSSNYLVGFKVFFCFDVKKLWGSTYRAKGDKRP